MDHLLRQRAPISDAGWAQIDEEATRTLKHYLAARKVVDYTAAGDWSLSAVNLGRVTPADGGPGVDLGSRVVQTLAEVRVPFEISRDELDNLDRGAPDFDTGPVIEAARLAARTEDRAVFLGNQELGVRGIVSSSANEVLTLAPSFDDFPDKLAMAVDVLKAQGIGGPYAIAMGQEVWTAVMERAESGGYPLIKHVRLIIDGPAVWAPALKGAVVISQRGGDFTITGGQDFAIGYRHHDLTSVTLYIEETFTSVVSTPEAAVYLDYQG